MKSIAENKPPPAHTERTPTSEIIQQCQSEIAYRLSGDASPKACFELFRRAFAEKDQDAWQAIYTQYQGLVRSYLASALPEQIDDLVNRTFLKFWEMFQNESFAEKFTSIGGVVKYLNRCARSVLVDTVRKEKRRQHFENLYGEQEVMLTSSHLVYGQVALQGLFAEIQSRLNDEKEIMLVRLLFDVGLKPRQVVEEFPELFLDVSEVHRLRERIVSRLGNDLDLQRWWDDE